MLLFLYRYLTIWSTNSDHQDTSKRLQVETRELPRPKDEICRSQRLQLMQSYQSGRSCYKKVGDRLPLGGRVGDAQGSTGPKDGFVPSRRACERVGMRSDLRFHLP